MKVLHWCESCEKAYEPKGDTSKVRCGSCGEVIPEVDIENLDLPNGEFLPAGPLGLLAQAQKEARKRRIAIVSVPKLTEDIVRNMEI